MKRIIWTGVGYSLGITTSVYVQRRVKRAVERYAPAQVRSDVADRSRAVADRTREMVVDLRDAAREGAAVMHQVERELLDEFSGRHSATHAGTARGLRPDRLRR